MEKSLKCILGVLLISSGLFFFIKNLYSAGAGIFIMGCGLLLVPAYWDFARIEFPKIFRGLNKIMLISISTFFGLCLFTIGLPQVDITEGERAFNNTKTGQQQELNHTVETSDIELLAENNNNQEPADIK